MITFRGGGSDPKVIKITFFLFFEPFPKWYVIFRSRKFSQKRSKKGMKKCHKKSDFAECPSCPFVNETKVVKSTANNFSVEINTEVDCQTKGIIYCITCKKCSVQYIGTSKKSLQDRFANHRGYVNNKDFSQPTGRHFNSRGHSISDMSVVIVEKVFKFEDRLLREERESHYIREFNSRVKGLNIDS